MSLLAELDGHRGDEGELIDQLRIFRVQMVCLPDVVQSVRGMQDGQIASVIYQRRNIIRIKGVFSDLAC